MRLLAHPQRVAQPSSISQNRRGLREFKQSRNRRDAIHAEWDGPFAFSASRVSAVLLVSALGCGVFALRCSAVWSLDILSRNLPEGDLRIARQFTGAHPYTATVSVPGSSGIVRSATILDCDGRAKRRHRFGIARQRAQSGVALRFPPQSKRFGCGFAGFAALRHVLLAGWWQCTNAPLRLNKPTRRLTNHANPETVTAISLKMSERICNPKLSCASLII